jgi:hypothetical protein
MFRSILGSSVSNVSSNPPPPPPPLSNNEPSSPPKPEDKETAKDRLHLEAMKLSSSEEVSMADDVKPTSSLDTEDDYSFSIRSKQEIKEEEEAVESKEPSVMLLLSKENSDIRSSVLDPEEENEELISLIHSDTPQPQDPQHELIQINDSHFGNPVSPGMTASALTEASNCTASSSSSSMTTSLALNHLVSCLTMNEPRVEALASSIDAAVVEAQSSLREEVEDNLSIPSFEENTDEEVEESVPNENDARELSLSFHPSDMSGSELEEMMKDDEDYVGTSSSASWSGQDQDTQKLWQRYQKELNEEEVHETATPSLHDAPEIKEEEQEPKNPRPEQEGEEYHLDVLVMVGNRLLQDMVEVDVSPAARGHEEHGSSKQEITCPSTRKMGMTVIWLSCLVAVAWLLVLTVLEYSTTPNVTLLSHALDDAPLTMSNNVSHNVEQLLAGALQKKDDDDLPTMVMSSIPLDWAEIPSKRKKTSIHKFTAMETVANLLQVMGNYDHSQGRAIHDERHPAIDRKEEHPLLRLWNMIKTVSMGLITLWCVVLLNGPSSLNDPEGAEEGEEPQAVPTNEIASGPRNATVLDIKTAAADTVITPRSSCTTTNWDLSEYETLKVDQLRVILRQRQCKTVGRKHILIQRLVHVYAAELETLTVQQLRPILKRKGCKQGGRKVELIQRLVEAGME